ncbi:MAG: nucleotidyltransferase [Bacteroidia bacterium]
MAKEIELDPAKESVYETLKANKTQLKRDFGVIRIGVFGKIPKSEVIKTEDINILVELNQTRFDLWQRLKSFIEDKVGDQVNLITNGSARSANLDITNKKVRRLVAFV